MSRKTRNRNRALSRALNVHARVTYWLRCLAHKETFGTGA